MANNPSLGRRWGAYRPTKGGWFWSCAGCIVATIVVGFAWGGWVTGGTAERMAGDAADGARAQLAGAACVTLFNQGPDAAAQLAALKKVQSYQRSGMIVTGGWVTMPGSTDPVRGAADICAEKLMNPPIKTAATTN
jgi:hypothetical protein